MIPPLDVGRHVGLMRAQSCLLALDGFDRPFLRGAGCYGKAIKARKRPYLGPCVGACDAGIASNSLVSYIAIAFSGFHRRFVTLASGQITAPA